MFMISIYKIMILKLRLLSLKYAIDHFHWLTAELDITPNQLKK